MLLQIGDHLAEGSAACLLGGFDVAATSSAADGGHDQVAIGLRTKKT